MSFIRLMHQPHNSRSALFPILSRSCKVTIPEAPANCKHRQVSIAIPDRVFDGLQAAWVLVRWCRATSFLRIGASIPIDALLFRLSSWLICSQELSLARWKPVNPPSAATAPGERREGLLIPLAVGIEFCMRPGYWLVKFSARLSTVKEKRNCCPVQRLLCNQFPSWAYASFQW